LTIADPKDTVKPTTNQAGSVNLPTNEQSKPVTPQTPTQPQTPTKTDQSQSANQVLSKPDPNTVTAPSKTESQTVPTQPSTPPKTPSTNPVIP
jgi:hypothetical protein